MKSTAGKGPGVRKERTMARKQIGRTLFMELLLFPFLTAWSYAMQHTKGTLTASSRNPAVIGIGIL